MKLSFSIKSWEGFSWDEFCKTAYDMGLKGIELHSKKSHSFPDSNNPFDPYNSKKIIRDMNDKGLSIPCMDSACDISEKDNFENNIKEVEECITTAKNLNIPYVRLHASSEDSTYAFVEKILPFAAENNVTLLFETAGIYSDTGKLRDVLNFFASDYLAALWDMHNTWFDAKEDPEKTIENLGAYVRHVHVKDSDKNGYCLLCEGELPLDDMIICLRSVNYDGFISLEWDPKWLKEIPDMDIILSHFVNTMKRFVSTKRASRVLYENRAKTGKYLYKKDILIDKTFSQVLDDMVSEFPDQYAFKYTTLDYTRTYSQFRDDVDTFARSLVSMGVKAGSHVTVWATNVPQWYIAFWATAKIGAVLVTMNTAYKIHEAEYLLRQSDTHTLIMVDSYRDSNYAEIIEELCPEINETKSGDPLHCRRLPFLRNIITLGFKKQGCITWDEAIARADRIPKETIYRMAAAVDIHDVCNMQYTSGTTGFPKGVMLTHYNVVNNGKYIGDHMDLSTADRMMIQVPMFHCFGMVLSMTASMTHGATIYPLPYFSPKPALACINNEHITAFNGVPTMFIAMMGHADFEKTDFSHVRVGIMAGANCPAELMKKAADVMNMKEIVSVYGQTEAAPGCTMSSYYDSLEVRTETVGSAFANVECKIIDPETGEDCPDGVNGEFVARGYNIMKGYYKMPKATQSAIDKDGWLHTGDLACRRPDGNYLITGRLKDMIIRGGENIYPKEIEEFIYTHPKVRDVQVIGLPDKTYGEEIVACVILKDGETMTEQEMKDYVLSHMAKHKVPRYVDFVKNFPMNAAGKILKYKMREEAIERHCPDKK